MTQTRAKILRQAAEFSVLAGGLRNESERAAVAALVTEAFAADDRATLAAVVAEACAAVDAIFATPQEAR